MCKARRAVTSDPKKNGRLAEEGARPLSAFGSQMPGAGKMTPSEQPLYAECPRYGPRPGDRGSKFLSETSIFNLAVPQYLIHNSAVEFTFFVDDRDPLETTLLMKLHQGKTKVAKGSVLKAAHVADEKGLA